MPYCDPKDVAIKSFFLGPLAENEEWMNTEINVILQHWYHWRKKNFEHDGNAISTEDLDSDSFCDKKMQMSQHLNTLISLYEQEIPKFTPRYIGHMVSEISLPAIFGHILNLLHNPNNISDEVSQVGLKIEDEAIKMLCEMIGYTQGEGHFTSGGTVANIESIWRARFALDCWIAMACLLKERQLTEKSLFELFHMGWGSYTEYLNTISEGDVRQYSGVIHNPIKLSRAIDHLFRLEYEGPIILVPGNKHYSWQKGFSLLGYGSDSFWSIALNAKGKLCVEDLKKKIEKAILENRPILMVVSVAGTTELGELDPVDEVQDILDDYKSKGIHIWHHVDAAYGGFYCSLLNQGGIQNKLSAKSISSLYAIRRADSVTLDPHKLGYVPYACGAILVKDLQSYQVSSFSAPYLIKNSKHKTGSSKWLSTIEGSRSGSGATATWLTGKSIGFHADGYGRILNKGIEYRIHLVELIKENLPVCKVLPYLDTNILCFVVANQGEKISLINERSTQIFDSSDAIHGFSVSKTSMSFHEYEQYLNGFVSEWDGMIDSPSLTLVRVVLMNPFFGSKEMAKDFFEEFIDWLKIQIDSCK